MTLDEFVQKFKELKSMTEWRFINTSLAEGGGLSIRSSENMCPITFITYCLTGQSYSIWDIRKCQRVLKINFDDIRKLENAIDDKSLTEETILLRNRLLEN